MQHHPASVVQAEPQGHVQEGHIERQNGIPVQQQGADTGQGGDQVQAGVRPPKQHRLQQVEEDRGQEGAWGQRRRPADAVQGLREPPVLQHQGPGENH